MPIIQPDLTEVKDMGPIEPGVYRAKILSVDSQTSQKGNPMIVPQMEIQVPGQEPKTRKAYLVITGAGAYGFSQLLRACGFDQLADQYEDKSLATKPPFDTDDLVGQELQVQIEGNLYNGQMRDQIAGYVKL